MRLHPPSTATLKEWLWYFCQGCNTKILSDQKPTCPICHWAMTPRAEQAAKEQ